jgi:3-dehydroquinate dehydratase-2
MHPKASKKLNILLVNGPNLNLLGEREPEIYGKMTLEELNNKVVEAANNLDVEIKTFHSNHEGAIIDFLHANRKWANGVIINPGALTHYSYALRDAITAILLPTVEVHLSDIENREPFRKISVIKDVCIAQISGKGIDSYLEGLQILIKQLREE